MRIARTAKMKTYCNQSESHVTGAMPNGRETTNERGETKRTSTTVRISSAREVRTRLAASLTSLSFSNSFPLP